jgi:Helix-turn-helix domain
MTENAMRQRNEQLALEQMQRELGVPVGAEVRVEQPPPLASVLALRKEDAARVCGVSDETFDRYIRGTLPVVRVGTVRVFPVAAIQKWLDENASSPADEIGGR